MTKENRLLRVGVLGAGLIARPAWLDAPCPPNLEILRILSSLLKERGTQTARELLLVDPEFQRIKEISWDNAASIIPQFERPNVEGTIATLANLPADAPCSRPKAWSAISVPTLMLVSEFDALWLRRAEPGAHR